MKNKIEKESMAEEKKYSLADLLEYRKMLDECSENDSSEIIYNDSYVHAVFVLTTLIRKARHKGWKHIDMFCGSFSIFRDHCANKLENLKGDLAPSQDDPSYIEWLEFNPHQGLMDELIAYLCNGGCLNLIVAKSLNGIDKEKCWDSLGRFFKNRKINAAELGFNLGLNHYVVTGDAYRRENSDNEKKALCCFNDEETSRLLSSNFSLLQSLSSPINL